MNSKLSFYALMSSLAMIVAVVSAAPVRAFVLNSDQTVEQRVNKIREALGQQNNQSVGEQQGSEKKNFINQSGWYNNWSNNPWSNSSPDGGWYNNWTNYNG